MVSEAKTFNRLIQKSVVTCSFKVRDDVTKRRRRKEYNNVQYRITIPPEFVDEIVPKFGRQVVIVQIGAIGLIVPASMKDEAKLKFPEIYQMLNKTE